MSIHTYQLSGAGNTFSIVWESAATYALNNRPAFVRELCQKTTTDGFIFLSWKDQAQNLLQWDFYNNDGSMAEMCGNATRCVAFFAVQILKTKSSVLHLQTVAGPIEIKILDAHTYEIKMTALIKFEHPKYFWCDTGVPHIVIEIPDFQQYPHLKDFCRNLRSHPDFQPRGTNVTLIQFDRAANRLKAVSYERGVEDFTQACGTGAMAAAFYNLHHRQQKETYVEMPGGLLKMNLSDLQNPLMTGTATLQGEHIYAT